MSGWIGVDLDGTLAHYDGWIAPDHIGEPIQPMVDRVKKWLENGREVRIFTARVSNADSEEWRVRETTLATVAIAAWCKDVFGVVLPITCEKDFAMIELWDDRCVQVVINTGEPFGESTRGL